MELTKSGIRHRKKMDNIEYEVNGRLTTEEFLTVLRSSTLAERRPVGDIQCMDGMVKNANLTVCARDGGKLVGVARSVTDFNYCCYLSDLAVDTAYQNKGIGRELVQLTKQQLGKRCKLILLSAPAAIHYYPKLGFKKHPQAWVIEGEDWHIYGEE